MSFENLTLEQIEKLERDTDNKLSRSNFLDFVKVMFKEVYNDEYVVAPWQEILCERLTKLKDETRKKIMVFVPPQFGKAADVDEDILTTDGWKKMRHLRAGDYVFGSDGNPTKVVAVSETWKNRECYRVFSDDGASVVVDSEHEWTARLCCKHKKYREHTTKDLAGRKAKRNPLIPEYSPVVFPDADYIVDPWLMGYWIGDGTASIGNVTVGDQDIIYFLDQLSRLGEKYSAKRKPNNVWNVRVHGLHSRLKRIGVLGMRRIPDEYLLGSVEQRFALLQGLVDSDGHVTPRHAIEVTTIHEELSLQIQHLVHTLGQKCSIIKGRAMLYGKDCGPKYRVCTIMANAARMPRKAERCRDKLRCAGRYLTFEKVENRDTVCIQVEALDSLFLLGKGLMLTHNSLLISRMLPAWILGHNPNEKTILGAYADDLASMFHRDTKRIMQHPRYAEIFPETRFPIAGQDHGYKSTDNTSEVVNAAGFLRSVGVGGSVTGMPGSLLIADDLFKGRSEAESPTIRKRVNNWWDNDFTTRMTRDANIVMTYTRWHTEDIGGMLLDREAEEWEVIRFPALFDGGEYTHPDDKREIDEPLDPIRRFTKEQLAQKKKVLSPRDWFSVWQQQPTAEGGNMIKADMLKRWKYLPQTFDELLTSWDLAFKKGKESDFNIGQLWGRKGPDLYLIGQYRKRAGYAELKADFKKFVEAAGCHEHLIEDKANGPALISEMQMDFPGIIPVTPTGDKIQRVSYILPVIESGNVYIPENADFTSEFIKECVSFPNGTHDDQVDAMSQAIGRLLLRMQSFKSYAALATSPSRYLSR